MKKLFLLLILGVFIFSLSGIYAIAESGPGNSYPATPTTCGNMNGDLVINSSDVDLLVNFTFAGGSLMAGVNPDLNGDGAPDILDVTILINYVYRNGPAPNCPYIPVVPEFGLIAGLVTILSSVGLFFFIRRG